jgi:hypothetical protein
MNPALISEIVALITQLGPLGFALFTKLESVMNLGPNEKQNIANAIAASNAADQETINHVAAWMASQGFKTQVSFVPVTP